MARTYSERKNLELKIFDGSLCMTNVEVVLLGLRAALIAHRM